MVLLLLMPLSALLIVALVRLLVDLIPNECLRHLRSAPLLAGITRGCSIWVRDAGREGTSDLGGIVGGL